MRRRPPPVGKAQSSRWNPRCSTAPRSSSTASSAPFPRPSLEGHKYARGHALVAGGAVMTGAARLAARAAARLGAGLVTVAAPEAAFPIYAAALTGVIVHPIAGLEDFRSFLTDPRRNAA